MSLAHIAILDDEPDITALLGTYLASHGYRVTELHTGTALLEYLQRRSRQHGQTIIMVTHDPKAAAYADRVLMLLDGRIVNDVDDPTADEVFALLNAVAL